MPRASVQASSHTKKLAVPRRPKSQRPPGWQGKASDFPHLQAVPLPDAVVVHHLAVLWQRVPGGAEVGGEGGLDVVRRRHLQAWGGGAGGGREGGRQRRGGEELGTIWRGSARQPCSCPLQPRTLHARTHAAGAGVAHDACSPVPHLHIFQLVLVLVPLLLRLACTQTRRHRL